MKFKLQYKYVPAIAIGFTLGALFFHPLSMVFTAALKPGGVISEVDFTKAFKDTHLLMALFFALTGSLFGTIIAFFLSLIEKERKRGDLLEGLLPICSYCKKIRDERTGPEPKWKRVEEYLKAASDAEFTHGICPDCYENLMKEMDEEDEKTEAHA